MAAPSYEAQRSLREITEAADELVRTQTGSTRARTRAIQGLLDASSPLPSARRQFAHPREGEALDWNESITTATLELRSANILAAASVVTGETPGIGGMGSVELLNNAIDEAKAELLQPPDPGFHGKVVRGEPSKDTPAARANFRDAANQTIDSIVTDSEKAVSAAVNQIQKRGKDLLAAFDSIAQLASAGAQIEGLLKRAWEKLQSGLNLLSQLVNSVASQDIRETIQKVKDALNPRNAIELLYRASETRTIIAQLQFRPSLAEAEIDQRRDQLTQLARDFSKFATAATTISALASAVLTIIAAHLTGPLGVLAVPATYALSASAVLAFGMLLNDVWRGIQQVRGIRDIAGEIAMVQAETA